VTPPPRSAGYVRSAVLMVRGCASVMLIAAFVALLGIGFGPHRLEATVAMVLLLAGSALAIERSRRLRQWSAQKTFEITYWMPQVDMVLPPAAATPPRGETTDPRNAPPGATPVA
jgi:hypothetical protein